MAPLAPRSGDAIFANVERVNAELFTLTWSDGAAAADGSRGGGGGQQAARSNVGFKMYLGVTATVTNWDSEGTSCSLVLEDNPLVDFVELPDTCQGLYYCNILSGVIRGALEMVSMKTEVTWVRDMLHGDDAYEMRVKLLKQVPEEYPYKDDE